MGAGRLVGVLVFGGALLGAQAGAQEPAPSPSPSPRADEIPGTREHDWREKREARRKHLQPYKPGFLERQILAFEKAERPSIFDFNAFGFYPRIQSIASGSRNAAGLRFWKPDLGDSAFSVHGSAFFSLAGYEFYDVQFGKIPHQGKAFPLRSTKGDDVYEIGTPRSGNVASILYGSVRYQHYPLQRFFGLGADSELKNQTSFLQQDALYEVVGGMQFGRHVALTGRAGYLQAFIGRGENESVPSIQELFDDASAPGLSEQPDFVKLTGQFLVDYRDQPGNPHRGGMLALQLSRFDARGGSVFDFNRFAADLRAFVPLGSVQRILALRAYASFDDASPGARVPFYLQETLGSSHTLRGFENFRFRGEDLLLLQAEYRWEAGPALELCLFAEAGKIARRAGDIGVSGLEHDFGFGLRLKTLKTVALRFDVARGSEATRYLLRFSPVF